MLAEVRFSLPSAFVTMFVHHARHDGGTFIALHMTNLLAQQSWMCVFIIYAVAPQRFPNCWFSISRPCMPYYSSASLFLSPSFLLLSSPNYLILIWLLLPNLDPPPTHPHHKIAEPGEVRLFHWRWIKSHSYTKWLIEYPCHPHILSL